MQFLVVTKQATPPPPEMVLSLVDAMSGWLAEHRASGKLTAAWNFAGLGGGGGVLEVGSHEELDEIMVGFPFGPFSSIEIYALSDLDQSLAVLKASFERMMQAMGPR